MGMDRCATSGAAIVTSDRLDKIKPGRLACLLDLDVITEGGWLEADLAGILQHQLHAKLVVDDLKNTGHVEQSMATMEQNAPQSFAALLDHPTPPVAMLQLFKRFAKTSLNGNAGPLPAKVAAVLYYLSIALALLRHNQRISDLADAQLDEGLKWVIAQPWVTKEIKSVAMKGSDLVGGRDG
ncbi:hypothetical protein ACERK3_16325 [Phycisphaerales bacterium AB-hyl4]|uniref:Uncharacterized protein n=1 Tax=Natronomicrosphaera hydrolytica TaxID=3242702 RepID=A0ABV4U8B3_9BACT